MKITTIDYNQGPHAAQRVIAAMKLHYPGFAQRFRTRNVGAGCTEISIHDGFHPPFDSTLIDMRAFVAGFLASRYLWEDR
jgi:hypothetical protein